MQQKRSFGQFFRATLVGGVIFLVPVLVMALPGGGIYLAIVGPVLRVGIVLAALGLCLLAARRVLA